MNNNLKDVLKEILNDESIVEYLPHEYGSNKIIQPFLISGKNIFKYKTFGYIAYKNSKNIKPAIILVHGGNGKAEKYWVDYYANKGFVAIVLDMNGMLFTKYGYLIENKEHNIKGYGDFKTNLNNIENSWTYHSVAAILLAQKYLKNLTFVDNKKIGIMGISWGGYLTYIASGVSNFAFSIPIYTSAYLYKDDYWIKQGLNLNDMKNNYSLWTNQLDPSNYISDINNPLLAITGINDPCFDLKEWDSGLNLLHRNNCYRTILKDLTHGQYEGSIFKEVDFFLNNVINNINRNVQINIQDKKLEIKCLKEINNFQLYYTNGNQAELRNVKWQTETIDDIKKIDFKGKVGFIQVQLKNKCFVSSNLYFND